MLDRGAVHVELGEEQVEDVGEGAAAGSFGWAGKPGQFVRENEFDDNAESDIEALLKCRLRGWETKSDVMLNRERAGDVVITE